MDKNFQEIKQHTSNQSSNKNIAPFEVILRRFNRQVQQNRLLSEIKKRRYNEKEITRGEKRNIARHKAYIKKLKRGY